MGSNGSRGGGGAGGAGRGGRDRASTVRALTEDEKWAIADYTRGEFALVNARLGGYEDKLDKSQFFERPETRRVMENLSNALNALPDAPGQTFRVMSFDTPEDAASYMSSLRVGGTFSTGGYLSTSRRTDYGGADDPSFQAGRSVQFTIKGKTGKDIVPYTAHKHEQETLFDKGTRFKVTSVTRNSFGSYSVKMEER